jgi:hypothetical protein
MGQLELMNQMLILSHQLAATAADEQTEAWLLKKKNPGLI